MRKNIIHAFTLLSLLLSSVATMANHWVPNHNQFSDNMNIIGVLEINGVEQAIDVFEIGVFCGDECRGSEMLAYYSGVDRHMLFMTLYGQSGDVMSFRLYDHGSQRELELVPPETIQFVSNEILGSIAEPYPISFSGGIAVITAVAVPEAGGTITGAAAYWYGETCTLQAAANEGYTFVNWTENGQQVSTEPTLSIFVLESHDLQANFSVNTYEITAVAMPDNGGLVSGMGSFEYGTVVTLMAEPNEHYLFANWSEEGHVVSNSETYSFLVTGDRHLEANFAQEYLTVSVTIEPEQGGIVQGIGNYVYGQNVTLNAIPNANYEFLMWTEEGLFVSADPELSFCVTETRNLTAHFAYYDGLDEQGATVSVCPNPAKDYLRVSGLKDNDVISFWDAQGRLLLSLETDGSDAIIDLAGFPKGVCFLKTSNCMRRILIL